MTMELFVARTMTTNASLEFCGALNLSLPQVIQPSLFLLPSSLLKLEYDYSTLQLNMRKY